jgi:beta-lactam-binding protein with PASTA domain
MERRKRPVSDASASKSYGRILLDFVAETVLNLCIFILRFLWWSLRWSFATVFFIAVMAGAGWYVFNKAVAGGGYVTVPNLHNLPITEAMVVLTQRGLEVGEQFPMPSDDVPKYHVIAQRPAAGRVIRAGRKVYPTVSSGLELKKAPDVVGRTLEAAKELLMRDSFRPGIVSRIASDAPWDTVIGQDPPANCEHGRGNEVHLLLSKGKEGAAEPFYMPDLVGKPFQEAGRILSQGGLAGTINLVNRPGEAVDVVLNQDPPAGSLVRPGDAVTYDVCLTDPSLGRRREPVTYVMPASPIEREVRIDTVDASGVRRTVFPLEQHYVNGLPPRYAGGTPLNLNVAFFGEVTVEIYLDGTKVRSYYFEGDSQPVITDYGHR